MEHRWLEIDTILTENYIGRTQERCMNCNLVRWESSYYDCCDEDGGDFRGFTYEYDPPSEFEPHSLAYVEPSCTIDRYLNW